MKSPASSVLLFTLATVLGAACTETAPYDPSAKNSSGGAAAAEKASTGEQGEKEDPAAWRDMRHAKLRPHWESLEGRPAPELDGLSDWLGGDARSMKDLRGKVVLIDMWATWCGPCKAGLPDLLALHSEYADDGLVILGVHSARGAETMAGFVAKNELPWSFATDKQNRFGQALGIEFIPTYFAVDRTGTMRIAGADRSKLGEIVKALIAE
jgi:thiol-disulfide isomerase/thioredoxin